MRPIHITRGALALGGGVSPAHLLQALREARDRLGVPPDDLIEDAFMDLITRNERDDDSERLADTRAELAASERAFRERRAELLRLQGELTRGKRRVDAARAAAAEPRAPSPDDDETRARLRHVRRRIDEVQDEVAAGRSERNRLQDELDVALKENEALRAERAAREARSGEPAPDDDGRLFPVDSSFDAKPVRVPVFPADFAGTLRRVPNQVGEAALVLAGRLAAGKRDAFPGCRGLVELGRTVWRQRVGGPYRLLFELDGSNLRIEGLIHRSKLERWIATRS